MQPLAGLLVVDLTRYLPGPYASRELLRLGARVVRVEPLGGDPVREVAPEWDVRLNAGKESVAVDLKAEPEFGRALVACADVVLEGFRPGVADRLGIGPDAARDDAVYCSITGFGAQSRRAGHDLNYLGWAGALAQTAPALPPVPVADLAAGGQRATIEILAALLERGRTGRGARVVVSMTHGAHELAHYSSPLTDGLPHYAIYGTRDGRYLTVAPLEPHFRARLEELVGPGDLAAILRTRTLAEWLELFDGEDVAVGPVATLEEAAAEFGEPPPAAPAPRVGEHTDAWRRELGLA